MLKILTCRCLLGCSLRFPKFRRNLLTICGNFGEQTINLDQAHQTSWAGYRLRSVLVWLSVRPSVRLSREAIALLARYIAQVLRKVYKDVTILHKDEDTSARANAPPPKNYYCASEADFLPTSIKNCSGESKGTRGNTTNVAMVGQRVAVSNAIISTPDQITQINAAVAGDECNYHWRPCVADQDRVIQVPRTTESSRETARQSENTRAQTRGVYTKHQTTHTYQTWLNCLGFSFSR